MSGARRAKRPDSGLAGKAGAVLGAVLFLLALGLELGWPAVQSVPAAMREENPAVSPGAGTGSGRGKSRLSLRAREIRYSEKTKVFLARGEVLIRLENLTITADEAEVDTERNIACLRGAVHL
ncbi:MAG: hypothetical protein QJR13_08145, partial [Bacillota bacterium]|nr:hypothetical protein [Bacillota bacterium]